MKRLALLLIGASLLAATSPAALAAKDSAPVKSCCTVSTEIEDDTDFAKTIGMVNLTEIALGRVAQENSASPEVKKFAEYMVRSHTEIQGSLEKLAKEKKIELPSKLDKNSATTVAKLKALQGAAFDETYVPAMVQGHTEVLAMIRKFQASVKDPAFKKFTDKLEPLIAKHLERAKKIQAELKKQGIL